MSFVKCYNMFRTFFMFFCAALSVVLAPSSSVYPHCAQLFVLSLGKDYFSDLNGACLQTFFASTLKKRGLVWNKTVLLNLMSFKIESI